MRISGPVAPRRLSEAAIAALEGGDVQGLLDINKREFGGFVMMADDDDDGDKDDKDDDAGDSGADKKKAEDKDAGSDGDGDDGDDDSDAELEKLRKRMKAADKRADEADAKLKKIEDAEKGELDKATERVTELEKESAEKDAEISSLRLQNAFLTSNNHTWHDPDTALGLAESKGYLDDVTDETSGEVDKKALGKALDRLAKEHSYLIKKKDKDDDEPGDSSGEPAGGRSDNSKDEKAKQSALKKRFPILQNR